MNPYAAPSATGTFWVHASDCGHLLLHEWDDAACMYAPLANDSYTNFIFKAWARFCQIRSLKARALSSPELEQRPLTSPFCQELLLFHVSYCQHFRRKRKLRRADRLYRISNFCRLQNSRMVISGSTHVVIVNQLSIGR